MLSGNVQSNPVRKDATISLYLNTSFADLVSQIYRNTVMKTFFFFFLGKCANVSQSHILSTILKTRRKEKKKNTTVKKNVKLKVVFGVRVKLIKTDGSHLKTKNKQQIRL